MAEFDLGFAEDETVRELSSSRKEPAWFLADRLVALANFKALRIEEHQLFTKYTDISRARVGGTIPYIQPAGPAKNSEMDLAGISGIYSQEEDSLETLWLDPELEKKGVVFETLQNAVSRHQQQLRTLTFDHASLPERDKFAQMTKALCMAGVVLHIPDNVSVSKPILIRWSIGRENAALLTRTVVSLGNNSSAVIVEETEPSKAAGGERMAMFGGTAEVVLGEGSILKYNGVENVGGGVATFLNRQASVGAGSEIQWAFGYVGGEMTRSHIDNFLSGRGATVREVQVLYGGKSQFFDIFSHTRHVAEDTVSDQLSKGVLQDQSKAYVKGLITIEKGGKGSDSYLGEFGMVLSRDSRFVSIPSLEIENHAVKRAKHASSVAQIDENQLFYLTSRGIEESEARKLIVMGFLDPVVARIPLEPVADRLRGLFESKWKA
jgi:Fe-S cluster assembly scaffold protein SufB